MAVVSLCKVTLYMTLKPLGSSQVGLQWSDVISHLMVVLISDLLFCSFYEELKNEYVNTLPKNMNKLVRLSTSERVS